MKRGKAQGGKRRVSLPAEIVRQRVYAKPRKNDLEGGQQDEKPALAVRRATPDAANEIVKWLRTTKEGAQHEFRWLGGKLDPHAPSVKSQVESWINSPYGSYLLVILRDNDGSADAEKIEIPVAFINIDNFPEGPADRGPNFEVGRLIVHPDHRRKGYGSTLLRHVTRVLGSMVKSSSINARVLEDNPIALAMFGKMPFRKIEGVPHYERNSPDKCVFFKYQLARREMRLGEQLARLRKDMQLTQAQTAFLCGLAPSMINQVESDHRLPSLSTLQDITSALASDQYQKIMLLLSILGERLDPSLEAIIKNSQKLAQEASPQSQKAHYWIFSDTLLEDIDGSVFRSTVSAIQSQFDRWFFVPPGYWESQGKLLVKRLSGTDLSEGQIARHLRFFKAPAALCALRIAVRVPHKDAFTAGVSPASASIGGRETDRFSIEPERLTALMHAVLKVVNNLEATVGETAELEGFQLLFPTNDGDHNH